MKSVIESKKILEKDIEKYPTLYMIYQNLTGLHPKVYHLKYSKKYEGWWDRNGNFGFGVEDAKLGLFETDGIVMFVTDDKLKADEFLSFAIAILKHLKERI